MTRSLKQKSAIQQQKVLGKASKQMTPELQARFDQLMALYSDSIEQTINFKHQLGILFNDVDADPKTYGADAKELLMANAGINDMRDVGRVMLFAKTYPDGVDVYKIIHWHEKFPKCKGRITWSHLDKLFVSYITDEARENWFDLICVNGWSCQELYRQIKMKYERGPGHGSKVKQPTSKDEI